MPAKCRYENLFSPGAIGSMRLRNRVVMAAIVTQYATATGEASL